MHLKTRSKVGLDQVLTQAQILTKIQVLPQAQILIQVQVQGLDLNLDPDLALCGMRETESD